MNELAIIGICIMWVKFGFPIIRILFPITRRIGKPINCAPCLSFWATLIYELASGGNVFLCGIVFVLTSIIIRKYDEATI